MPELLNKEPMRMVVYEDCWHGICKPDEMPIIPDHVTWAPPTQPRMGLMNMGTDFKLHAGVWNVDLIKHPKYDCKQVVLSGSGVGNALNSVLQWAGDGWDNLEVELWEGERRMWPEAEFEHGASVVGHPIEETERRIALGVITSHNVIARAKMIREERALKARTEYVVRRGGVETSPKLNYRDAYVELCVQSQLLWKDARATGWEIDGPGRRVSDLRIGDRIINRGGVREITKIDGHIGKPYGRDSLLQIQVGGVVCAAYRQEFVEIHNEVS